MPGSIQASTALDGPALDRAPLDRTALEPTLRSTCAEILDRRAPNLFRLYLNPYVAQACFCLTELVAETWPDAAAGNDYQVFLANSLEEALSGAIKLTRYANNLEGKSHPGVIIDPSDRLKHFAATNLSDHRLEYIPSLDVVAGWQEVAGLAQRRPTPSGFMVMFHSWLQDLPDDVRLAITHFFGPPDRPRWIVCTDRESLGGATPGPAPDIVVFDESFTEGLVPLGAFAARRSLFQHWAKRGMTLFHSTTYQPNTVSTLQFLNCLRRRRPEFFARHSDTIERIATDFTFRRQVFSQRYNRSLAKLIKKIGWHTTEIKAAGHYVDVAGRQIFDGVAGVACSIRGHNPPDYLAEVESLGEAEACRDELSERLAELTGLPHSAPGVSGASAVEHALKLGLVCQQPRNHVLVMRGGFGGKTLFALTGTWKPSLRQGIDPLYPHVVYVDPFADDAVAAVETACEHYPVGVIQFELIQGVGGVRELPADVVGSLVRMREKHGCLLFVDEVQTGMYRTGPFVRSSELGIKPDLLTIGKGTSDMMFPFALTLYSDVIEERLTERSCDLATTLWSRYRYDLGLRTLLNVLRHAERERLDETVRARGEYFDRLLRTALGPCQNVPDVRSYGLLIGIELAERRGTPGWLSQLRRQLSLLAMLNHPRTPLLVGYCQYEPHVLKLTPPLSVSEGEAANVCQTIATVLQSTIFGTARAALLPRRLPSTTKSGSRTSEDLT